MHLPRAVLHAHYIQLCHEHSIRCPHLVVHYLSTKRRIHIISEIFGPEPNFLTRTTSMRTFSREQYFVSFVHGTLMFREGFRILDAFSTVNGYSPFLVRTACSTTGWANIDCQ